MAFHFSKTASKKLESYQPKLRKRIVDAIELLPNQGNIRPIHSSEIAELYRLRLGGIRVIFQKLQSDIKILLIDSRGDIYKKI